MSPIPIPILMYHSIDTEGSPAYRRWVVSPKRFHCHMAVLADGGYWPLTMGELVDCLQGHRPLPPNAVAITFDDGFRDFVTGALPILEHFGHPSTLFVVAGQIGGTATWLRSLGEAERAMLDWADLRQLTARGVEIGAHTMTHPQLDILPRAVAKKEIVGSKAALEQGLGIPVRSFAYPHGYATAATRAMVEAAGFSSACRVRHALSAPTENRFALSRIIVTDDLDDVALTTLLQGRNLPVAPPVERLASYGWRWVRRLDQAVRPVS